MSNIISLRPVEQSKVQAYHFGKSLKHTPFTAYLDAKRKVWLIWSKGDEQSEAEFLMESNAGSIRSVLCEFFKTDRLRLMYVGVKR